MAANDEPIDDDRLLELIAIHHHPSGKPNATAIGAAMGRSEAGIRRALLRLAREGRLGTRPVLPGFGITQVSTQKRGGETVGESIQQRPVGEATPIPPNFAISQITTYESSSGSAAVWTQAKPDKDNPLAIAEALKAAFADLGSVPAQPIPPTNNANLLTTYVLGDHHLGLLAWKPESGESYDLKSGEKLLLDKLAELVSHTPTSHTAIFENLGDFFHSNNARNQTENSGNLLDVDGRYAKVLQVGLRLAVSCIDMLLAKHARVIVAWLRGNHDPEVSLAMLIALQAWFRDEPRVEIEFNPSKFFVHKHGKTLLTATHGDMVKPNEMAGFVAGKWPDLWGASRKRYAHLGHVHHSAKGGEANGLTWESFQTLAAKDAWHAGEGYLSDRSMTAITYHDVTGEFSRNRVSV
jgi:Calcineurin-like phosphoesterase